METPKFGYMTNPLRDITNEIKKAKKLGFDFVEIGIEAPAAMPEDLMRKREQILTLLNKYKTFAIAHTTWWIELGSLYDNIRKAWLEEAKKAIRVANELGIKEINFHAETFGLSVMNKKYRIKTLKTFVQSLDELVDYAGKFNMGVMLENVPKKRRAGIDINGFRYIMKRVKGLGLHLNIGHAFIEGKMKCVEKYIKTFRDRLWHIHIHDNHGESDEHLAIGNGEIDYERVIGLLKNTDYNRTISFEVFTNDKEVKQSLRKIKRMWHIS